MKCNNVLDTFTFQHSRVKVKGTVAISDKNLVITIDSHLWADFDLTSHKDLVRHIHVFTFQHFRVKVQ